MGAGELYLRRNVVGARSAIFVVSGFLSPLPLSDTISKRHASMQSTEVMEEPTCFTGESQNILVFWSSSLLL